MEFRYAIELDLQPVLNPRPVVVLMREYENGNILEHINRIGAPYSQRAQWVSSPRFASLDFLSARDSC